MIFLFNGQQYIQPSNFKKENYRRLFKYIDISDKPKQQLNICHQLLIFSLVFWFIYNKSSVFPSPCVLLKPLRLCLLCVFAYIYTHNKNQCLKF